MKVFRALNPQDLYYQELYELRNFGEDVDVRGRTTKEILNVSSEVRRPWNPCILIPARRWNPWLALSEGLWILAGRDDVEALKPYNSHITDYSDDGVHLYGAYGKRIYDQIDPLIERLRKDPSDRRAVLQIWEYEHLIVQGEGDFFTVDQDSDLTTESKDPPCNNMVYFKLRDNKLHMTVINRSNDIHWGLFAVNLPTFGMLQQYIAARLGVEQGEQCHFSNSLHYYTDDKRAQAITERMTGDEIYTDYPEHTNMFVTNEWITKFDHEWMASACTCALDDTPIGSGWWDTLPFIGFARDFLKMYREHDWQPKFLDQRYADWIKAGDIFVQKVWNRGS